MGKASTFARARNADTRRRRDQRSERSRVERDKRLGVHGDDRKVSRVVAQRRLPDEADRQLLSAQFTQACRLPASSTDLCLLMRHYAGLIEAGVAVEESAAAPVARKRARDEEGGTRNAAALQSLADVFLSTVSAPVMADGDAALEDDEDEDPMTVLLAILQSNSGHRVVSTMLAALHSTPGCEKKCTEVAKAVLEQYEENEHLADHHVACRVLSALVQCGTKGIRESILGLLRQRGTDDGGVKGLLTNRHTSVTVENLLKYERDATAKWLCEALGLFSAAAGTKKSASKKSAATSDGDPELLMKLIEDPVASQVLKQLVSATTRPLLLGRLDVTTLLQSKRGTAFLATLLTVEDEDADSSDDAVQKKSKKEPQQTSASSAAAFSATLDKLLSQVGSQFAEMAADRRANFVVQKIIMLVPHVEGKKQGEYFSQLMHLLGGAPGLMDLAYSAVGAHVVCTLVEAALKQSSQSSASGLAAVEEIGSSVFTKSNVSDIIGNQYGSLVVRRLMPLVAKSGTGSKTGYLLLSAVQQNMSSLVYDGIGNLVVQEYIKAIGQAEASAFARKLKKEELLAMCRNQFAAHVVFTLLSAVDPTTHTTLCNLLRPYVPTLATHLNGRFIVEKIIPASRDVRDELVRQFLPLANEKGTQHVLCTLVASLDPRGKQSVLDNVIGPNIRAMASNSCGSVALQKLMQSDAAVLATVRGRLEKQPSLVQELAQSFYGKFVVNIAMQGAAN